MGTLLDVRGSVDAIVSMPIFSAAKKALYNWEVREVFFKSLWS